MLDYNFNFSVIWRNADEFLTGLGLGLGMALISLLIGCVIGLLCAYGRTSRFAPLRILIWLYVEFVRNTPLLLLIFFVYFGLPEFGIFVFDKVESFILTLALYAGAYMTEIFRAGIESIPRGQWEAARARLEAAGVETAHVDGSSLYFRGPDGERLELISDPLREMYGKPVG